MCEEFVTHHINGNFKAGSQRLAAYALFHLQKFNFIAIARAWEKQLGRIEH